MGPSPSGVKGAAGDAGPWLRAGREGWRGADPRRHEYQQPGLRGDGWRPDAAGVGDVGESTDHMRADAGSLLVVSPGQSSPHCSPLLDKCPPACLQYMRSARANRSGRPPGSGWKEFDRMKPLRAAARRERNRLSEGNTLRGRVRRLRLLQLASGCQAISRQRYWLLVSLPHALLGSE